MQIKLGILNEGDEIFDIFETRSVVKRKNNKIEILDYYIDEENIIRIKPTSIIMCNKDETPIEGLVGTYYLLDKEDELFKVQYDKLYIKKKSGEIEIFSIVTAEDGCYLEENSIIITFGNRIVSVKKIGTDIEVGTF